MTTLVGKLTDLLGPTIAAMGYQLWGVEYLPNGKNSVLRLFIDSDRGIDIDDCADVSRQVSGLLDVEDPLAGEYNLEVSSPGMARPLFVEEHYQRYCGQRVKLKLSTAIEGRRNYSGQIVQVEKGDIKLRLDGEAGIDGGRKASKKEGRSQNQAAGAAGSATSVDADKSQANFVTISLWQVSRGQLIPDFDAL